MTIQIKFFAGLMAFLPEDRFPYEAEVAEGATVAEVLAAFRVPEDKPRILLVNGRHVELAHRLQSGDVLAVFPPVAGG